MIKSRICATQADAQQKEDDCPMLSKQGSAPTNTLNPVPDREHLCCLGMTTKNKAELLKAQNLKKK